MKIKKILQKNQKRLSHLGKFSKVLGNFSGPPTIPPLRPPVPFSSIRHQRVLCRKRIGGYYSLNELFIH